MNYEAQEELQKHIDANEKLIWTGQPKKGIIFRTADIFMIPFSLLWCGFAIFWFYTAITSGAPIFFALFGVPFVAIGLTFVFGRFIIDAKQRAHTFYGITHERIIIKSGIFKISIKSLPIKNQTEIECEEKPDGSGTINFGTKNPMMVWGNGMNWWPGVKVTPSLDSIPEARKVYQQILSLQKSL
jgi:hypothetical protein